MPLINVPVIEGVFSDSQKRQMIEELTGTMVGIEGENIRPVTWVVAEEAASPTREPHGAAVRRYKA